MLRDSELARRTESGIQLRAGPIRLRWELTDLLTSDGHVARGFFTASASPLPDPTEVKMLEEALLGSKPVATSTDVVAHFAGAISSAARNFARNEVAQTLLGDEARQNLATALVESAAAVAFSCGLEILQPAQVELDCPTLQRRQMEELDRQAAQRRAADQVDQLRHSAELFRQFESVRASAPELSPGQVLSRIGAGDQADVFRALMLASAKNNSRAVLWAAAGNSLLRIDTGESPRAEIVAISDKLGPLRSIRPAQPGELLLGCRSGVIRLNPDSPDGAIAYLDSEVTSQLGFNAAVLIGDRLWASHREAGLVCWLLDQPEKPDIALRPSSSKIPGFSPRNLCKLDSRRAILSTGGQLLVASDTGDLTPLADSSPAEIVGLFVQPNRILTAHADGQVCLWNSDDLKLNCRQRRTGRIVAASVLPWLGDARILLASEDGPVTCVGPDDELVTHYASSYSGLRIAAGANDAVAAVTADRQRLILWHAWDGRKPHADLFLYNLARHRIADIAFV